MDGRRTPSDPLPLDRPPQPRRTLRVRMDDYWEVHRLRIYISGLTLLLLVIVFWPYIMVTIPAGHRGVMFRRFYGGTVLDQSWPDGFHVIPPWDHITIYETRITEHNLQFDALSKEGLEIAIAVTVRVRPVVDKLGYLHETVGPDYFDRIVAPEVQAFLRSAIGDHTSEQLYAAEASFLTDALQTQREGLPKHLEEKFIHLDELLVRRITLPPIVRTAIEEKAQQDQAMQEYSFRIDRERKEAERKRIEAEGIRDFQKIIGDGISNGLLRWRGIEATLDLARSNNSKLIIMGGDGKLPVILDGLDGVHTPTLPGFPELPPAPAAPAAPTAAPH